MTCHIITVQYEDGWVAYRDDGRESDDYERWGYGYTPEQAIADLREVEQRAKGSCDQPAPEVA